MLTRIYPKTEEVECEISYRIAVQNKFSNTGILDNNYIWWEGENTFLKKSFKR